MKKSTLYNRMLVAAPIVSIILLTGIPLSNHLLSNNRPTASLSEPEGQRPQESIERIEDKDEFTTSKVIVNGDTCLFVEYGTRNKMSYSWQIIEINH